MTALATSLGSSSAHRIDLTRRAGKAFPIHTMTHGFALHANGRVEVKLGGPRLVFAHVRAGEHDTRGRVEAVRLEAQGDRLLVGCSCPGRSFGMLTCKHAWAVLLEAETRGHLEELRTSLKPCVVEATEAPPTPPDEPEPTGRAARRAKQKARKARTETEVETASASASASASLSSSSSPSSSSSSSSSSLASASPPEPLPASTSVTTDSPARAASQAGRRARRAEAIVEELIAKPTPKPEMRTKKAKPRVKAKALAKTRVTKPKPKKTRR